MQTLTSARAIPAPMEDLVSRAWTGTNAPVLPVTTATAAKPVGSLQYYYVTVILYLVCHVHAGIHILYSLINAAITPLFNQYCVFSIGFSFRSTCYSV